MAMEVSPLDAKSPNVSDHIFSPLLISQNLIAQVACIQMRMILQTLPVGLQLNYLPPGPPHGPAEKANVATCIVQKELVVGKMIHTINKHYFTTTMHGSAPYLTRHSNPSRRCGSGKLKTDEKEETKRYDDEVKKQPFEKMTPLGGDCSRVR